MLCTGLIGRNCGVPWGVDANRPSSPGAGKIRHVHEATDPSSFQPDLSSRDAVTEVLRRGARRMAVALDDRDVQGCRALVRNGYLPERGFDTGIGPVAVELPSVRVRATKDGEIPKVHEQALAALPARKVRPGGQEPLRQGAA